MLYGPLDPVYIVDYQRYSTVLDQHICPASQRLYRSPPVWMRTPAMLLVDVQQRPFAATDAAEAAGSTATTHESTRAGAGFWGRLALDKPFLPGHPAPASAPAAFLGEGSRSPRLCRRVPTVKAADTLISHRIRKYEAKFCTSCTCDVFIEYFCTFVVPEIVPGPPRAHPCNDASCRLPGP